MSVQVASELDVPEQFLCASYFFFIIFVVDVHRDLRGILEEALEALFARRQHLDSKGAFLQI